MPTTRNRWQIENQQSVGPEKLQVETESKDAASSSKVAALVPENEIGAASKLPQSIEVDDVNPRSPKRRRISLPEASAEEAQARASKLAVSASNLNTVSLETSSSVNDQTSASLPPQSPPSQSQPDVHDRQPPPSGPNQQTRLDNLSILSNLSTQLLSVLATMSPSEALQLSRTQTSQTARGYQLIRSLFNPVRQLYIISSPFLSPTALGLTDPEQVEILRKANQAIYMSSIFTGEVGLRDMDQNFLEVFVPEQGKLLKAQGSIYLELKTQAFITARRTGAAEPLAVMAELFPLDMESKLLERRPGTKTIAPSEQDFLKRMSSRREILLGDVKNNTLDQLPLRYRWEDLSREVSAYLAKNFDSSTNNAPNATETSTSQTSSVVASQPQSRMQAEFSIHEPPMPVTAQSVPAPVSMSPLVATPSLLDMDDFVAQAARAAEIAMQSPASAFEPPQPVKPPAPEPGRYSKVDPQFQHYTPAASNGTTNKSGAFPPGNDEIPHSSQTAPTRVLYERARLATTAKASPLARKPVTPSQRRPWTPEEEAALMTGLDQVKGPHWSQILAMYGPGGTINESLKDRNQVQLKDKARNLKLFFLKAGIEVPYYLKYVTGDLKTRAPGQAEKREARERERLQNEEHRAHFDGLMALAGAARTPAESESPAMSTFDGDEAFEGEAEAAEDENAVTSAGPDMADIEAMIARAAAQASEPMPPA